MNILFLEDDDDKFNIVSDFVLTVVSDAKIVRKKNWLDYVYAIQDFCYDLILLDLVVPKSPRDDRTEDHSGALVETTRNYRSKSYRTPAIVLTRHSLTQDDLFEDLNAVDISVISFNDNSRWKDALTHKLEASKPRKKFDAVIVCALEKEGNAFQGLTDTWGPVLAVEGLTCREVSIGNCQAVIVYINRAGLVAAALASAYALERFEPKLICMSGICGGMSGESKIYDLLVTQTCHQHDAGKWSDAGFKSEHYDAPLDVLVHTKLLEIASDEDILRSLTSDLNVRKSEFPDGVEEISITVNARAATSSGSAVLAEEGQTARLAHGQRKLSGFDMEVYSVYEAARNAKRPPKFFAAKAVVDDGDKNKGDNFHRVGCLLSARFVVAAIRSGLVEETALPL